MVVATKASTVSERFGRFSQLVAGIIVGLALRSLLSPVVRNMSNSEL